MQHSEFSDAAGPPLLLSAATHLDPQQRHQVEEEGLVGLDAQILWWQGGARRWVLLYARCCTVLLLVVVLLGAVLLGLLGYTALCWEQGARHQPSCSQRAKPQQRTPPPPQPGALRSSCPPPLPAHTFVGMSANAASPAAASPPNSRRRCTVACATGSSGVAASVVPPPVKKSTSASDSQLPRSPLPACNREVGCVVGAAARGMWCTAGTLEQVPQSMRGRASPNSAYCVSVEG